MKLYQTSRLKSKERSLLLIMIILININTDLSFNYYNCTSKLLLIGLNMIDTLYIAQLEDTSNETYFQKHTDEVQSTSLFDSKTAGRFEIVKMLPLEAENFDDMFNYADAYGKIRLAYIDSAHKISTLQKDEKRAAAIGGVIGVNTASYKGVSLHIATYISQSLEFLNPDKNKINEDFFNSDKDSFAYIAEASLQYNNKKFQSMLGRIKVETPYANSDDIRMAANTFEGAWLNIDYDSDLKTQILFLNRWAGYDSQDDEGIGLSQDTFKNLVNDKAFGMLSASLSYEFAKESELSFWYNYIDEMSIIHYCEIIGVYQINAQSYLDYGVQISKIYELDDSNVNGKVFGAMLIAHYNGWYFAGAYNAALVNDGDYITSGFGGGPYYTSLDEATIEAVSEASRMNSYAYRIGSGYDFSKFVDGLNIEIVYGQLYNEKETITEEDLVLTYKVAKKWLIESVYTNYRSQNDNNNNTFDRYLLKIDYNF